MYKKLSILFVISLLFEFAILSCTTTAEKKENEHQEYIMNTMQDFHEQGITPLEFNNILKQSAYARHHSKFNVYISGEFNTTQVILDLGNAQINKSETSFLIPMKIVNKANKDLYLNRLTDKLYIILTTQNSEEATQLHLLGIPQEILSNNESVFIAKFDFKDENEGTGFKTTLMFLKIYINSLNSLERPLKKKELSDLNKYEKDMQAILKGKFDIVTEGISIPLTYKIDQTTE